MTIRLEQPEDYREVEDLTRTPFAEKAKLMLRTKRLTLRPWFESDADALFKYASDPDVGPRAGWPPHNSREESLEIIRTVFHNDSNWAIELNATGEAIGAIGYGPSCECNLPAREGEPLCGYWVAKPYWNQGICTEALQAMLDYIRRTTDIQSLISGHFVDNPASGRVMEKCGFQPTGETCIDETQYQRTGFGKSLCYQFPATQFDGITVIFSPLIALMRDQVKALNNKGISARYINSEQTVEENSATIQDALDGKVKILYIAPERQENAEWIEATRKMNLSMVVIDEAHTISVWGHDFRPAFRRIINLVKLLPQSLPVLATTATATNRVQSDIEHQIGGRLTTIRGQLVRDNFRLYVIKVHSEDEKLVWLAQNLHQIDGTGLIYTGTRVNTEIYAKWLAYNNINAINYNAGHDADTRKDIENGLMHNRYKCVVSTNALGMGIDKPDIRFIIHTQIPASPIHYYQEIGRAGRDDKPTTIILFYNEQKDKNGIEEDYKLPKAFIDGARPSKEKYLKAIDALRQEPLSERGLMKATNLKQTQIRVIKADLIDQGIAKEVVDGKSKVLEYQFGAQELDTQSFEDLRMTKLKDLDAMVGYVNTTKPRMQYLCEFLDDGNNMEYSNCDNTTLDKLTVALTDEWGKKLILFRETYFPDLEVKSRGSNIVNGVAASYYGVSNVGSALHRSKYENGGDFPDFLLRLTLKAFFKTFGNTRFDRVLYVSPTHSGDLVKNFAVKFASVIKVPVSHKLVKIRQTSEQKVFQNSYLKQENVKDAFSYLSPEEINGKKIILLDDIFDSGATIKEIGKLLTALGAETIVPIAIAKTVGGDI